MYQVGINKGIYEMCQGIMNNPL